MKPENLPRAVAIYEEITHVKSQLQLLEEVDFARTFLLVESRYSNGSLHGRYTLSEDDAVRMVRILTDSLQETVNARNAELESL